jgi:hypothetical protein
MPDFPDQKIRSLREEKIQLGGLIDSIENENLFSGIIRRLPKSLLLYSFLHIC